MARILVIDDYPAILSMLELILATAGHEVVTAENAGAGLSLAGRLKPDLVLLDVDMPEMNGLAACDGLKGDPATRHIPVLLMTGRLCMEVVERARRAGAYGVLPKPFFRARLLEEVTRALAGIRPRP
ncbi:MAG: pilH [Rariglobus sp.]|jgi:CheY-like chemotaxis protein|nr:pilH [Rariglobus sp.]